jgi:hypothetical protein
LNIYYVYAYLRKDGTPYYIGKGCGNRINAKHGNIGLPPQNRRVFLEKNLTEIGAWSIERRLIRWWKRKVDGGVLQNEQEGGPVGMSWSNVKRPEQSEKMKGVNNPLYGVGHTKEAIQKMKRNSNRLVVSTPFGIFDNAKEASKVIGVSLPCVINRCRNTNPGWEDWNILESLNMPKSFHT